jgi:hypothetical protein
MNVLEPRPGRAGLGLLNTLLDWRFLLHSHHRLYRLIRHRGREVECLDGILEIVEMGDERPDIQCARGNHLHGAREHVAIAENVDDAYLLHLGSNLIERRGLQRHTDHHGPTVGAKMPDNISRERLINRKVLKGEPSPGD